MLKKAITYVNFNGDTVTNTFYFNLTQSEITEMEVSMKGGMGAQLQRIVETQDLQALMNEIKNLLLGSYGVKSEDGERFVKNAELREAFYQTAAYDVIMSELTTDAEKTADFVKGIMPAAMVAAVEQQLKEEAAKNEAGKNQTSAIEANTEL